MAERIVTSPLGPLYVAAGARGIREVSFLRDEPRLLDEAVDSDAEALLDEADRQIQAYFIEGRAFDLPLDLRGSEFQRRAWAAIAAIPFGQTASYRQVAASAGNPNAYRAAGSACGANPVVLVVPCHRVIGSDGGMHGFGAGMDRKLWLLHHEALLSGQTPQPALTALAT